MRLLRSWCFGPAIGHHQYWKASPVDTIPLQVGDEIDESGLKLDYGVATHWLESTGVQQAPSCWRLLKPYIQHAVKLYIYHKSVQLGTKLLTLLIRHELHRETVHSSIVKRQELLGHRPAVITTSPSLVQTW
jgi:hypothetical protein